MARRISIAAALAVVAASLLAPASSHGAACPNARVLPNPVRVGLAEVEAATLCLMNAEREDHGLEPLRSNARLAAVARAHSSAMRWGSFFAHESLDGSTFVTRIAASGYTTGARSWRVGENIVWGSWALGTPNSMFNRLMDSPPHRQNILKPGFREIGIGADWGSPEDPNELPSVIVTTDFGYRR